MSEATPRPWFLSGCRVRMNDSEWHSINRYDESKKQDENIACVGYDPRTGAGLADAHLIVEAVNSYDAMRRRIAVLENVIAEDLSPSDCSDDLNRMIVEGILDARGATK